MEQYKREFIEFMIDCEVLKFGDFVTKSGIFRKYRILPYRSAATQIGRVLCQGDRKQVWL